VSTSLDAENLTWAEWAFDPLPTIYFCGARSMLSLQLYCSIIQPRFEKSMDAEKAAMVRSLTLTQVTLLLAGLIVCSPCALGQNPQLQTRNGGRFPTVVFNSVVWNANPASYSIAIDATGAATYQSTPDSVDRTGVPYSIEFQTSDATRRITFNIARELNLFSGDFPVSMGSPQTTPVRTLVYHDIALNNHITYSDSTDSQIQELTSVFEEISATFEFARRLGYLHQHDKERLEPELTRMQASAERHMLRELQAVTPALKSIALDTSLSESVRKQAEAILVLAHKPNMTPDSQSGLCRPATSGYWYAEPALAARSNAALVNVGTDKSNDFIHGSSGLENRSYPAVF
jgi:hypothetical protein